MDNLTVVAPSGNRLKYARPPVVGMMIALRLRAQRYDEARLSSPYFMYTIYKAMRKIQTAHGDRRIESGGFFVGLFNSNQHVESAVIFSEIYCI